MKITRENYEAYLLDFVEGTLSAKQQAALFAFLEAHPDLNVDLDLPIEPIPDALAVTSDWSSLLKPIPVDIDQLLIAKLEGDFEPSLAELDYTSVDIARRWNLFQKTKIQAPVMSFTDKDSLSMPPEVTTFAEWKAAVAEGDLSNHAVSMRASQELVEEVRSMSAIRLTPEHIIFGGKEALLQQPKVVALYRNWFVAVASVAAIFICVLIWPNGMHTANGIAEVGSISVSRQVSPANEAGEPKKVEIPAIVEVIQPHFVAEEDMVDRERNDIAVLKVRGIEAVEQEQTGRKLLKADQIEIRDAMLYADATKVNNEDYQTLTEYVKEMAQKDLLKVEGSDEPIAAVLVDRAVNKIEEGTSGIVKIQPSNKQLGTPFSLKLGKLEISRSHK